MNLKKLVLIIAVAGLFVAFAVAGYVYFKAFTPNTTFNQKEVFVYIPSGSTYEQAKEELAPFLKNMDKFDFVAKQRKYDRNVKAGKFLIKQNMNSFDMIRALRQNIPVKVAFNNQETLEKLVQRLATQLEPDSLALVQAFTAPEFLQENGFTEEDILAMFIPNSYEFYWNTPANKLADKFVKEYKRFWNPRRIQKAMDKNLSPVEVSVLASIVHKETAKVDERPRVAGVYLNRLRTGMPLQADPTIIYAMKKKSGDFDQVIKRVLHADLTIESPYNTYKYAGLPPGPIAMPDISAIDAVLNAEDHNYIYFCASPDKPGYHAFATNFEQHQVNARKYAQWVNKLGINR
ncbi:endolytic transglycosylase MltG [Flavobacterium sediminis]|uniref:Endolytic murein transglycosylase n=1 Tax=Flavobacterium sediminis TaxID=2201181 RepID=A0A2U8QYE7_9FLAO|nr:endolytic transglycosylase MltG [Flavobacterium sediminis]AWM15247.1 endolytic transglycosylase MltG [Flavobacterium sediminis]